MNALDEIFVTEEMIEEFLLASESPNSDDIKYINIDKADGNTSEALFEAHRQVDVESHMANELIRELADMINNVTLRGSQIAEAMRLIAKAKKFLK